jgi:hypothetical protein
VKLLRSISIDCCLPAEFGAGKCGQLATQEKQAPQDQERPSHHGGRSLGHGFRAAKSCRTQRPALASASNRQDYERAIRRLSRAEQLASSVRDSQQYDLEIKAWTIKSRIQLLTAHLAMGDKEGIRSQLRNLLNEQMDVRAALLKRERERAQDRLAKIDQDLSRLEGERQKIVENHCKC